MSFTKTILEGVKYWVENKFSHVEKELAGKQPVGDYALKEDIPEQSQADWNQNDETAADYVKNRPFYTEDPAKTVILEEQTVTVGSDLLAKCNGSLCFEIGKTYFITFNGVEYERTPWINPDYSNNRCRCIGNGTLNGVVDNSSEDPFLVETYTHGTVYLYVPASGDYTISISEMQTTVHQIDIKYVPHDDTKLNVMNPVGYGSFSMQRKEGSIIGSYSHTEGQGGTASGHSSHAEGLATIAAGDYQHAQGLYNIEDTENKYAHIVGNGEGHQGVYTRSNAHTLDWNGVGWFQGGLQVGGNAQDDGAKNVLLEGDAIPVPTTATVGQTIAVKTVDENGKPTEWEAINKEITVNGIAPNENGNIELGDGYEWHEYKLWGESIRYIANIPGAESISDWEGLMTVPDPDYPDEYMAIDNILGFISDIFDSDPSEIDTSILEYCGYLATSYLALREAGIFGEDVYFATKLAYPEDQRVRRFHFLYIPTNRILYMYKYRLEESSLCIEYDIANNKILTEVTDLDFPAIRRYVKHTTVPAPSTAEVGQTIVVKAVDENGKPTEWEATDPWVINSSTEGSTKKFKITIDDDGVLTATEIEE